MRFHFMLSLWLHVKLLIELDCSIPRRGNVHIPQVQMMYSPLHIHLPYLAAVELTNNMHHNLRELSQLVYQFSVPQIEYPLGGSSKKGSHVYFLLIVAMVLLLWRQIILLWHQVAIVASEQHLYQNNSITHKTFNRKYTWLPF